MHAVAFAIGPTQQHLFTAAGIIDARYLKKFRDAVHRRGLAGVLATAFHRLRSPIAHWRGGDSEDALVAANTDYWLRGQDSGVDLKSYSHWEGSSAFRDRQHWYDGGRVHFEMFLRLAAFTGIARPVKRVVEWGCGGGMNAVHFIDEATHIYGVEISPDSLQETARQMRARGFDGFVPILIPPGDPEAVARAVGDPCQFFFSMNVFQSLPGKAYAIRVTRTAFDLLETGGLALIQIRYDDGSKWLASKDADYRRNAVDFTSFRIDEYWTIAEETGFEPVYVTLLPALAPGVSVYPHLNSGYAYFALRKPLEGRVTTSTP